MIDSTFIESVAQLGADAATPEILTNAKGHEYSTKPLYEVIAPKPPAPSRLEVSTLTGIVAYLLANPDKTLSHRICHVISPSSVQVYSSLDDLKNRHYFIAANTLLEPFRFGQWYPHEEFIIQLQSRFQPTDDSAAILKLVGNIKDETVSLYNDDGVTQQVTARTGIARVEDAPVPPRVKLAPFRTFLEVDRPESEFVFRLKQTGNGGPPNAALFESDGGAWKNEAIANILGYLKQELAELDVTIIA